MVGLARDLAEPAPGQAVRQFTSVPSRYPYPGGNSLLDPPTAHLSLLARPNKVLVQLLLVLRQPASKTSASLLNWASRPVLMVTIHVKWSVFSAMGCPSLSGYTISDR